MHAFAAIKEGVGPAWFSIRADEATDVNNTEQINVSVWRVGN